MNSEAQHSGAVAVIGPMRHDGARAYFGRSVTVGDGRSYADVTRDAVVEIVREGRLPAA